MQRFIANNRSTIKSLVIRWNVDFCPVLTFTKR
jgi:hypothetical protein